MAMKTSLAFTIAVVEAQIEELTISEGTLDPPFESEITTYEVTIENSAEHFSLDAIANVATKIVVNGTPVPSGEAIVLNVGVNTIEITVVDRTYTITVTRQENSAPPAPVLQNQTVTAGMAFHYVFPDVTDPDPDQSVTYSATLEGGNPLPAWLRFDTETRTFSGTPDRVDIGAVIIAVMTMDDGAPPKATRAAFTLSVDAPRTEVQVLKSALASFGRTVATDAVFVMENRFIFQQIQVGCDIGRSCFGPASAREPRLGRVVQRGESGGSRDQPPHLAGTVR